MYLVLVCNHFKTRPILIFRVKCFVKRLPAFFDFVVSGQHLTGFPAPIDRLNLHLRMRLTLDKYSPLSCSKQIHD